MSEAWTRDLTEESVRQARAKAYGNTVYRCPTCGFQAFGAPVTYHEMFNRDHAAMMPLERLLALRGGSPLESVTETQR